MSQRYLKTLPSPRHVYLALAIRRRFGKAQAFPGASHVKDDSLAPLWDCGRFSSLVGGRIKIAGQLWMLICFRPDLPFRYLPGKVGAGETALGRGRGYLRFGSS
jgi:hypothetical protein